MKIETYYNHPELFFRERRKKKFLTMATSLEKYLKYLFDELDIEDYRFSHLVEDMALWIVMDPDRLRQFILDNYDLGGEKLEVTLPPDEVRRKIDTLAKLMGADDNGQEEQEDEKEDKRPDGPKETKTEKTPQVVATI